MDKRNSLQNKYCLNGLAPNFNRGGTVFARDMFEIVEMNGLGDKLLDLSWGGEVNAAQIFSRQGKERVSIATLSQGQLWPDVDGETWCACMNLSDCRLVRSITPAGMDVKGGGKAAVHRSVRASRIGNMRVPRAPKRGERQGSQGKGVDLRSKYTPRP